MWMKKITMACALAMALGIGFVTPPSAKAQVSVGIEVGRPGPDYVWLGGYWGSGA